MAWRKKRVCSSAGSCSIGGNDDLLTEILVLFPTKSVVRFKSVSKHWLFLISGESFTRLHIQNHCGRMADTQHSFILVDIHGSPQFFICHPTVKKLVRVSLSGPLIKHKSVKILQSMNGLLLLSLKNPGDDYVVFNPTTKQYRFIHLDGYRPLKICLIFEPSKSEYYKLVMTTSAIPGFSVYDSATQQWSHGRDFPLSRDALGFSILLHNLITCSLRLDDTRHTSPNLLRIPEMVAYRNYMFESNEHLNILQLEHFREDNKRCFRVGEMIDDKWVICKKAQLDFDTSKVELFGMIREQRMEGSTFLFHVPGQLLIYKFSDGQGWRCSLTIEAITFSFKIDCNSNMLSPSFTLLHLFDLISIYFFRYIHY